jgi:hypothetical protein
MAETATGLMSAGNYANISAGGGGGMSQGIATVANGASIIFGQVLANRSVRDLSINYDAIVAEDIHRDNRSLMVLAVTLLLAIAVAYVLVKK